MKRRDFLKTTSAASAPLLLNGLPLFASPSTGNSVFDPGPECFELWQGAGDYPAKWW
jgi:hypothetical protein